MMLIQGDGPLALPAHLQGLAGLGVGKSLMAAIGDTRNRIGLKGNRFRQVINGQEVGVWDENYLDVIIVGVVPTLSRIWYEGKYKSGGDNAPPACYSVDNVTPAADVTNPPSTTCAQCPKNIKGSRIGDDGHEGKACSYFRRMAIMLPGDDTLYYVDVKAMGLFGESNKSLNQFSMNDYAKFLETRGVDASLVITRLSFDTDSSVPKLLFKPYGYIDEYDAQRISAISETNAIQEYLTINMKTVDISKEVSADDTAEDVAEPEAATPAPAPVAARPAPQTAPRPAPATTVAPRPTPATRPAQAAPAARPAAKPVQTAAKPVAKPAPVAARPAQGKPVAQAPKPVARAVTGVLVDSNVPAPVAVPIEISGDDEMKSLLGDLGL
jgi:hypothetical protein